MVNLELPDGYGNVLLVTVLIVIECQLTSYLAIGPARYKAFPPKFLKQNFGEEHSKHFKTDLPKGGYPDMGNGRYAAKLSYPDWVHFNNAQRAFQNFLEQVATIVVLSLVAGLKHAVCTYYVGILYIFARFVYALSYFRGPDKRFPAVGIIFVCLLTLCGLAIHASLVIADFKLIIHL